MDSEPPPPLSSYDPYSGTKRTRQLDGLIDRVVKRKHSMQQDHSIYNQHQPIYTCPFPLNNSYDQTQGMEMNTPSPSSLSNSPDIPPVRRKSSSQMSIMSGISPSMTSLVVDELRPFPVDQLPEEILHLILDHVLRPAGTERNGRWQNKKEQGMNKIQMVKAMKRSAALHLKFSLIHRSWTPYILKSLYRFPVLTSRQSITHFGWCMNNPLELWGSELMPNGEIGGAVGCRRRFVQTLKCLVGLGRHSATDYLTYSGTWFAMKIGELIECLKNAMGFEFEGWCSMGCEETRDLEYLNHPVAARPVLEHMAILRSPFPADVLEMTLMGVQGMRTLELLDIPSFIVKRDNIDVLKRGLRLGPSIETFALKVEGKVDNEGAMNEIFDILPRVARLQIQADLLSFAFFDNPLPGRLESLLVGLATHPPISFKGRAALEIFWNQGRAEAALRQQAGYITDEPSPHLTPADAISPSEMEIDYNPHAAYLLPGTDSPYAHIPHRHFSHTEAATAPTIGLERWLVRMLSDPDSDISKVVIRGPFALKAAERQTDIML